jgi:hypothetical protein
MQSRGSLFVIVAIILASFLASGQSQQSSGQSSTPQNAPAQPAVHNGGDFSTVTHPDPKKVVPKDTVLVKGAWYSASDSTTPVPEDGNVTNNVFTDSYFRMTYTLPADWMQKYTGPPPSDSGRYVLAEIRRPDSYQGNAKGSILIMAQDMFFSPVPANNARQFVRYNKNHLQDVYQVELNPTETKIAGQPFTFFAYWSPVAELHWYILATEIRCHTVELVLMNRDPKTLEGMVRDLDKMKLPAEASSTGGTGGGDVPVCIKDYATGDNVIEQEQPIFPQKRYNAVPVRIIIDKDGNVKHIHILSAWPEQQKAVMDALKQWKFRPYERDGKRLEVETGIMFGTAPRWLTNQDKTASTD